ncbi:MAG: hypothetical protein MI748_12650 [Opitutales bacterium]|nr:hypothetical protein [Opitutales bacterium]
MFKRRLSVPVLVFSGLLGLLFWSDANETGVLSVNGKIISDEELVYWMKRHRSKVFRHFHNQYGDVFTLQFWDADTNYENKSPLLMLKRIALSEVVKTNVILQLAQSNSLIKNNDFIILKSKLLNFNQGRRNELIQNKVIYGPETFSEHAYVDHKISNLRVNLGNLYLSGTFKIPGIHEETLKREDYDSFESFLEAVSKRAQIEILPAFYVVKYERD